VCWYGVYYAARAFLPLLVASSEGRIVNTSSVNGFWASLGPMIPHTAYSAAKFAVKGFTEALLTNPASRRYSSPLTMAAYGAMKGDRLSLSTCTLTIDGLPLAAARSIAGRISSGSVTCSPYPSHMATIFS